jgi:hypothetical protein
MELKPRVVAKLRERRAQGGGLAGAWASQLRREEPFGSQHCVDARNCDVRRAT